jgi:hypothetical protein
MLTINQEKNDFLPVPLEVVISRFEEPSVPVTSKTFHFYDFKEPPQKTLSIMAGYLIFQIFYEYRNWLIESIENHGYES